MPARRVDQTFLAAIVLGLSAFWGGAALAGPPHAPPNVVLVFADDLGYGDLGCYGAKKNRTPNLDRMAAQGVRLTGFCSAQAVCSASRAALLTGCYPNRIGILGALGPRAKIGINASETTLAEVLKKRGYATAIYGKWHLGDAPQFLPPNHGFDDYFGLPYSNDMWPRHPTAPRTAYPELPLIEGTKIVKENPDQTQLSTWYAERAVRFIAANKDRPFFLYVPHSMPHVPLHVSEKHRGKSPGGAYGDVIEEIDWSVGQILAALAEHKLDENTLVIFTSDNGPWLSYGNHAGTAGPLREGKGTTFEGGVRVPCIARWPGKIPPGRTTDALAATIDLLPTIARLANAPLPENRIDGMNVWPVFSDEAGNKSPRQTYYYYWNRELQAVRDGKWKLHLPHEYRALTGKPGSDGNPAGYSQQRTELALFDLEADVGEAKNLAAEHSDVVARLQKLADAAREDLGDALVKRPGKNVREPGRLP